MNRDSYKDKERQQTYSGLFSDQVFSRKKEMQYLSKQEKAELSLIPEEAIIAIEEFDFSNAKIQTPFVGDDELEVSVPLFDYDKGRPTLLYALNNGTAYTVENGNIYIWYKPEKGYKGSGYYRLKRYFFRTGGTLIAKYFLNRDEKL